MARYLIGDIQGCFSQLQRLLDKADFNSEVDELWPVGDLIGRGPESLETLSFLYQHKDIVKPVLGNHDLHFLAVFYGIRSAKPQDKLDHLLASDKCSQFVDWLMQQPLARVIGNKHLVSHAGLYPEWSIKKAIKYSGEFQSALMTTEPKQFFSSMYGDLPDLWDKDLVGEERIRFIINAFTRMRYVDADLKLSMKEKMPLTKAPEHLSPWFSKLKRLKKSEKIYFGHWASLDGKTSTPNCYALDTGCVWGGQLTMLRYEDDQIISIS